MQILIVILCILAGLIAVAFIGGILLSTRPYNGPVSDHFDGKRFKNPSGVSAKGFDDVIKYMRTREPDQWQQDPAPPLLVGNLTDVPDDALQYTFVNHSTFFIQHGGVNLLTDPIWSERCSPFQFMGPRRMRAPGMLLSDLPKVHLVLITHNHYDHLDKNTVLQLISTHDPDFIVPLGVGDVITRWGGRVIGELDWYDPIPYRGLTVTATPCNHFSSRGILDRNTSLWCGYTLQSEHLSVYYTGDTGYSDVFCEIGEKLGPFDVSFIPIGAFKPEWFMGPIHISPAQAVQVHQDVQSRHSVAMHFGTFPLADDNRDTDLEHFASALSESSISPEDFVVPVEGEVVRI